MQTRQELENRLITRAAIDETFRALLLENPHEAVRDETGATVPESVEFTVHEESRTRFHLILPASDRIDDRDLEQLSGGSPRYY